MLKPVFSRYTLAIFALSLIHFSVLAQSPASQKLSTLLDEIWQYELSVSPLMASSEGIKSADSQLPDISPAALKAQHAQWQNYSQQLNAIAKDELTAEEQISLLMQQYRLDNYIDEYRFQAHLVPLTSEYGFHSAMGSLARSITFKTREDYQHYLQRLGALKKYFEQNIAYMKTGLELGYTQPKVVLQGFEDSVKPYLVTKATDSTFYSPFTQFPAHISAAEQQALKQQAEDVILNQVVPAYQMVYDFLVDEYIPNARDDIAARNWPDGEAYYQNRIRHYTTTDMTAREIHDLGLAEVKRIRNEMQAIVDKLEFDGDINAFIQFLRTDRRFYASSAEELLKEASFIAKKMDARLPRLFEYLPRTPYGVEPVPDSIAPKYTTGRYVDPTRDDQPGYYWVNTYALDKRPLYALTALTLHEAVPGHHLQISLASEMQDLPKVRQQTYISAFGEGWGLYSEFLGVEVGMYEDPYDDFGRLSYEMWRACRLVVDTGMHMFGWSRQQSLDFMLTNTALSEHNVRTEIDRYISWPAQALSYKIGEIQIKALRKQAEQELGSHFDVRRFHRAVLEHGSVPLFILKRNIETFIEAERQKVK
ncbi:DUF885 domain-containing protein [Alteromonas aestuariivivens]|uniref:DUF885 domain-containing protein n=1 Tax=Alteromonas aestuariivivens TaxID=1938339 RepID=A0A3D8M2S5_9ALTE|nr:DUF885 domain-containing protein [Alteromonas aestuariivivens]RDV23941.1 DUF885 domain-containing protein [Alteromonas aestuariivivens]